MLEHTMARAGRIAPACNQVTVVSRTHLPEVRQMLRDPASGSIVLQPRNRDTAAGVFLPLTYVRARDPHATVVIYPSDHFIYPEAKFVDAVESERDPLAAIGQPLGLDPAQVLDRLLWFDSEGHRHFVAKTT